MKYPKIPKMTKIVRKIPKTSKNSFFSKYLKPLKLFILCQRKGGEMLYLSWFGISGLFPDVIWRLTAFKARQQVLKDMLDYFLFNSPEIGKKFNNHGVWCRGVDAIRKNIWLFSKQRNGKWCCKFNIRNSLWVGGYISWSFKLWNGLLEFQHMLVVQIWHLLSWHLLIWHIKSISGI